MDTCPSFATSVVNLPSIAFAGPQSSYLFFLLDADRSEPLRVTSFDLSVATAVPGPCAPSVLVTSVGPGSTRIVVCDAGENAWERDVEVLSGAAESFGTASETSRIA